MNNYLIEIDLPTTPNVLLQYYDNIYVMKTAVKSKSVTDSITGKVFYYSNDNQSFLNVKSVYVDGVKYSIVSNLDDLFSRDGVFYFSYTNQELYIKFTGEELKLNKVLSIGVVSGFSAYGDDCYYNNTPYAKKTISLPKLKQKTDSVAFGVLKFANAKFSFDNGDGDFDYLEDLVLYGQELRLLKGPLNSNDYSKYLVEYRGNISSYSNDYVKFSISTSDQRKNLSYTIPDRILNKVDFPDMEENSQLPVAYGNVRNAPTICLTEENATATQHEFSFMDTANHSATSISEIRAEGEPVTPLTIDLNQGTFILSKADCFDGDILKTITMDFRGADLDNSIDIIQDILVVYGGLLYTEDFFQLDEWEEARASSKDVAVYSNKDRKIIDIIKDISVSNTGVFFQNTSGKYTFRKSDETREPAFQLEKYQILPKYSNKIDGNKFFTTALVLYDKNQDVGSYRRVLNDTKKVELQIIYKTTNQKEIKTLLTNSSDAEDLAQFFLSFSETQEKTLNIELELREEYQTNLLDIILAPSNRDLSNLNKYEVLEYQDDHQKGKKILKLRYIREA